MQRRNEFRLRTRGSSRHSVDSQLRPAGNLHFEDTDLFGQLGELGQMKLRGKVEKEAQTTN